MALCPIRQLLSPARPTSRVQVSSPALLISKQRITTFLNTQQFYSPMGRHSGGRRTIAANVKASPEEDEGVLAAGGEGEEDGVSLGTMKLPLDTDVERFDSLLFQWANSLCQGANLPLPVPLKVDKIPGGARLGFITIGDGKTEVLVYIDCLVFPATSGSGPIFRAIRNGPLKDTSPAGEPRIMRSLLLALKKSVEIARL